MKRSEDPTTSEILHRLVVPIQTRGNLGKSTEAIARCEWMTERSITWRGYDLDAFNRTLSTTYPEEVVFVEPGLEPEGELIKIFRGLAQSEVTVIDPSAHMNRTILRAMEMVRLMQLCEAVAARVTVLIYPVDEVSDMDDIAQTVEVLRDSADWVIVRNPVRIPTTKFKAPNSRVSCSALEPRGWRFRASFPTPAIICAHGRSSLDADYRHQRRCGIRASNWTSPTVSSSSNGWPSSSDGLTPSPGI